MLNHMNDSWGSQLPAESRVTKGLLVLSAALIWSSGPVSADDDSTFLCKQIESDSTLIFSATTVVSKDRSGTYSKPTDVTFAHTPNGSNPYWTTLDGSTRFVLMKNQIYVMDAAGNVHGKIVCE